MLAGLLWPLVLLIAYAIFVWCLWRETTAEVIDAPVEWRWLATILPTPHGIEGRRHPGT